jgi:predicted MPP superfamily phosphohydrolase
MSASEKTAAFIFILAVTTVYALEIFVISRYVLCKIRCRRTNILHRKAVIVLHVLASIGILCLVYGYFVEPYWIEVNTVEIATEKLSNERFRVVHISDLHCDTQPRAEPKLVKLVNSLEPDVIVFTGDSLMLNAPSALPLFKDTMESVKAKLAKVAVCGNVDVWYFPELDLFGKTGFEVLEANSVKVAKNDEAIEVSGLRCKYPSDFREVLEDVPDGRFSVFLYHYSDLVEDLEDLNVDLYLCGHTHGGQVAIPFYGALVTLSKFGKKYESGMYTVGDILLYVNRGIGMEGGLTPKVRFFARPEITVFDIVPKPRRAE